MSAPFLVTPPASLPLTVEEVKEHCRVDITDDDALINGLINAAVSYVDGYSGLLNKALITQTWATLLPCFATHRIYLNPGKVQSIESVAYYDDDNALQTLPIDVYGLYHDALGSYIGLKKDQSWPTTYYRDDAINIQFISGYGNEGDVPQAIKQALLLLIGHWYENREATMTSNVQTSEIPFAFNALIAPYRKMSV